MKKDEIKGKIYSKSREEFDNTISFLEQEGYEFKEESRDDNNWFGILNENVLQRKGKCHICNSLIEVAGIRSHGRICESCGEVIYLRYKKNDLICFSFKADHDFFGDITLKVFQIDDINNKILFYQEIPEQLPVLGKKTIEAVQEKLTLFKDCYEYLEINGIPVLSFNQNLRTSYNDETPITIKDSRGEIYNKSTVVQIYNGVEYDEFGFDLPIPQYVTIYRDWKITKDASEIVIRNGMINRPGYYSGRGATLSDLSSKHLEGIYKDILEYHGKEASNNFVKMVSEIKVLSATDFLINLNKLEKNSWVWDAEIAPKSQKETLHYESEGEAIGSLLAVLGRSRSNQDDTNQIRGNFLRNHGIAPKGRNRTVKYDQYGNSYHYE